MKKLLLILSVLLFAVACSENKKSEASRIVVDPGFSSYVNAFTSGIISCKSNIKVVLIQPYSGAQEGDVVQKELFEFEPSIEGVAYWLDNQTIEFRPNENLPSGEVFTGTFKLGELILVPEEYQTLKFGFKVITQHFFVNYDGIRTTNNEFTEQELYGTLRTTDYVDASMLEECLTAKQSGRDLEISWQHAESGNTHSFTVKGVERKNKKGEVAIRWSGEPIGVDDIEGDMEIEIATLQDFSVAQVRSVQSPGLFFSIQFSDPVDASQDLTGLINLRSGIDLRCVIEGNEIKAYPLQKVTSEEIIVIDEAIVNVNGNKLSKSFEQVVQFNLEKPAVELLGNGVIMPSEGKISFPFKAINLKSVNCRILQIYEHNVNQFFQVNQYDGNSQLSRVGRLIFDEQIDLVSSEPLDFGVWNNFNIDISNIIDAEPGAIYRVMISFEQHQSLYPCPDMETDPEPLDRVKYNFDEQGYFYSNEWFQGYADYSERENPCHSAYYKKYNRPVSSNILASNFGIIAKETADNIYNITVTDLITAESLSGIEVEAINYQGSVIGTGNTNSDGVAQFRCDGKPYLLIAKEGKNRGYLRVDNGSSLSVSLYDVGGAKVEKGIKGFIYGERGVWRPGDTLFLSFMLEDKQQILPETHPVIMELYDPLGKLYAKQVKTNGVKGLYAFPFKTNQDDATGKWMAKVKVGNSTFSKMLKIETVKPNRIKIDYDFDDIISSAQNITTTLNAKWLYGSPGANLDVNAEMFVSTIKTTFDTYDGYYFDDRSVYFSFYDPIIVDTKTDAQGNAYMAFDWSKPSSAPGMLKLSFNTKVYEPGGDFSQDFLSKKYSPFSSYVGLKLDKGTNWLTALDTEAETRVAIAAVTENGEALSRKVKVELYELDWNWWWEGDGSDEMTNYINRSSNRLLKSDYFNVENGKSFYNLSFPKPDWGRFLIRVVDTYSGHSASTVVFGRYSSWYNDDAGGDNSAASALNIETGKAEYTVGEKIQVTVPSGGIGNIFVTVEKGDKIIDQMWVKATDKSTTFSIDATAEMTPNIYVSAFLIQPHGQDKNSLPIRMYGVTPVKVYDKNTKISPQVTTPKTIQPEQDYSVTVSEQSGKPMAYTLAVVDEGLLSLTRYSTPDPWDEFYKKEALSVRSWDMYKYVMSAQTGKMTSLLAIGGDEGLQYKEDAEANRFKPVVKYIGPFYLKSGEKKTHTLHMPNYIGAVRIMVVAGYEGAYGAVEKEVEVKQPLMVLTTLPRVIGPSETVRIPVNVITMDDRIKSVNVSLTSNELLQPIGASKQTVPFAEKGGKTIYFDYKVARKLGVATMKVVVNSGNEQAFEETELLVRPPNPQITQSQTMALAQGKSWSTEYSAVGIQGSNAASFQISSIPDLELEKHLAYLIRYPHGCIEQTTSSVFPQLNLQSVVELTNEQKDKVKENIIAGLNRLKSFQISSGGLSYWPGGNYPSEWGTNYAGHFIIEAKNKGYDIPPGLIESVVKFQKTAASQWQRARYTRWGTYGGDLTQAYRLYVLALSGNADIGAMNRLRKDPNLSDVGAWRLAAAYAIVGRDDVAKELSTRSRVVEPYKAMSYNYGSDVRDLAMILETLYYLGDLQSGLEVMEDIANRLKQGWHSTQTRAYAILAIGKYLGNSDGNKSFTADVTMNGSKTAVSSSMPVWSREFKDNELMSGTVEVTNTGTQMLFVSLTQSGIPVEMNDPAVNDDLTMYLSYVDIQNNPINVSSLKQGTDFKAIVTISHPGNRSEYKEVALSQIFPSGWQIVNSRIADDAETESENNYTYRDIRDDRVYTYFDIYRGGSKTFEVLLNATFVGKFYMPAVYCAPMYDESVKALQPGRWIEVVE